MIQATSDTCEIACEGRKIGRREGYLGIGAWGVSMIMMLELFVVVALIWYYYLINRSGLSG